MKKIVFGSAGNTNALTYARNQLENWGYPILPYTDKSITHLLLPVPSISEDGRIHGGDIFEEILSKIGTNIVVFGGNLPALSRQHVDFLKDEAYLTENAAITANCAMKLLKQKLTKPIQNRNILIIGWGRIGKCLAELIKSTGAKVTLCVRKKKDMEALHALGNEADYLNNLDLKKYDVIINTAPADIADESKAKSDALLIDLASVQGITGDNVIWARCLPNKMAPDESGLLIAKTALRYAMGKE